MGRLGWNGTFLTLAWAWFEPSPNPPAPAQQNSRVSAVWGAKGPFRHHPPRSPLGGEGQRAGCWDLQYVVQVFLFFQKKTCRWESRLGF